jgi:glycosyltransferase involved in cell wall biosynthesis
MTRAEPRGEPSIAVVVPNRNDSRYLPRCLSSVLDQEVPPDELIVVDDQSTDDSVAVIRSLIAGRPGAQLVLNPRNLGTYGAIDVGTRESRSEYVLFLSANDFVLPGIFRRAKSCLARHRAGLWSAMGWLVDERDRPMGRHATAVLSLGDAYFDRERCRRLAHRVGNWFTGTTLIYRRDALHAVGGFDPAYKGLSDLVTALIIASRYGAAYSPAPLSVVRIHSGSFISNTVGNPATLETILDRLRERGPELEPELFTAAFLRRASLRFRYACVRASAQNFARVADVLPGWRGRALRSVAAIVPPALAPLRSALAFLVLRPFDVVSALSSRFYGAFVPDPRIAAGKDT